jgi:uncharacterized protein
LMIAAFARAARVCVAKPMSATYRQAAQRAARFIRTTLWREQDAVLLRRYRDGEAAIAGYAEDYAYLVFGLLELFQADGDPAWLEWVMTLQDRQDALFGDPKEGGWFSTTGQDPAVLLRLKEDYDGAEPAAGSVAVLNVLTLEHLTGKGTWLPAAERTLSRFGPRAGSAARAIPMMLAGLSAWHAEHTQIVIVGPPDRHDTQDLLRAVASVYRPFAVTVPVAPGVQQESLARLLPWIGAMRMRDDRATAYVCRAFACNEPVTDAAGLLAQL